MKLKELVEKYGKLLYSHIELDKELGEIEREVGELLGEYPGVGYEETIVNALRELYELMGWRHPTWKE